MTAADRAILDFLAADPKPIRPLLALYPKATLYHRLGGLRARGLVAKHGTAYVLTSAGLKAKVEREAETVSEGLTRAYPPLREVPTPQHRAVLELAFAAQVLRQHTDQDDRHAGFALLGPTLTWKTSAGSFLCLAAGVDPATHVVDLASESGKSLWIRRGPAGEIVAQRLLLDGPVVVFDEYQLADPAVRRAIAPFLSGRRRVPVENTLLTIVPVPMVLMNPGPGTTLTARTGLPLPQLRRVVPCDLGALELPDLALEGGRALQAARRAGPLPLRPPQASCEGFRNDVVRLLRQVAHPEALRIIDVELLLGLGRGMTAWWPAPAAMRQVLYDFLLAVETVGWTKPGWLDRLRTFPAAPADAGLQVGLALTTEARLAAHAAMGPRISLFPERLGEVNPGGDRAMTSRESIMPAFTLSEQTKALLVWLIHETGTSPDRAVTTLIKIFGILRKRYDFQNLQVIVALREQCDTADLSVADLRAFLEQTNTLKAQGLAVSDAGAALTVAEQLAGAGLTLDRARAVADLIEALRNANLDLTVPEQLRQTLDEYRALGYAPEVIDRLATLDSTLRSLGLTPDDLEPRLRHLERLNALGLDPEATDTLANALEATGLRKEQRAEAVRRLPEIAARQIEVDELRALQEQLRQALERLTAELAQARQALQGARKRLASLNEQDRTLTERIAALQKECIKLQDSIVAGRALETFLVTSTDLSHPFWTRIAQLRALKERRPSPLAGAEALFTEATKQEIVKFLARITATPTTPPPGAGA